jgi:hypothetical protein
MNEIFILDTIRHCRDLLCIIKREVALKAFRFTRVHCIKEALYVELWKQHPIIIDDEEVLVELSVFSASLTSRLSR